MKYYVLFNEGVGTSVYKTEKEVINAFNCEVEEDYLANELDEGQARQLIGYDKYGTMIIAMEIEMEEK